MSYKQGPSSVLTRSSTVVQKTRNQYNRNYINLPHRFQLRHGTQEPTRRQTARALASGYI